MLGDSNQQHRKGDHKMENYDPYLALDWSQCNMAIARLTNGSSQIKTIDVPTSITNLKDYLGQLRGKKIMTLEETTTSQWLYTELRDKVDELVVCDPYRNRLLSEGPKTDRIDAEKLVKLLKAGLLKGVYHSGDQFMGFRKIVSGYEDLIKAGVRLKNQRAALFRAQGKDRKEKLLVDSVDNFVLEGIEEGIVVYESRKKAYEKTIEKLVKKHKKIAVLESVAGIGKIGAIKIAAIVVDPERFGNKGKWLSFCGLIDHEKTSGGKSYGRRKSRYSRTMKSVFKTAALSVIFGDLQNPFYDYYRHLIDKKGYPEYQARHAVSRRVAVVAWGVFKSGKRFQTKRNFKVASVK